MPRNYNQSVQKNASKRQLNHGPVPHGHQNVWILPLEAWATGANAWLSPEQNLHGPSRPHVLVHVPLLQTVRRPSLQSSKNLDGVSPTEAHSRRTEQERLPLAVIIPAIPKKWRAPNRCDATDHLADRLVRRPRNVQILHARRVFWVMYFACF